MVKGLLAVAVLLLVGCKSSPTFVGKWTCDSELMDAKSKTVSEHLSDGTFKSVTRTGLPTGGVSMTVTDIGTWKLDGEKLTLMYKDVDWKFSGGTPELLKRAHDRFKNNKASIIAEANRTGTLKLVWKSRDEFEYTVKEGEKYTYRRQK